MKTRFFCSLSAFLLLVTACQEQGDFTQTDCTKAVAEIPRFALEGSVTSRTDIHIDASGVTFAWNASDSLGVFPKQGYQAAFSLAGQPENDKAVFDGGTWRLRPKASYAAYYPFSDEAYDLSYSTLKASYHTQCQHGNNNTTHLPAQDYLAAGFVTVNTEAETHFTLSHLGSLVRFVITAPTAENWHYLRLKGAENEFIVDATYSLSESQPHLHAVSTADTVRIDMENITTTSANQQILVYAMVASNPAATSNEWAFTLRGDGGIYRDTLRYYVDDLGNPHYPARYLEPGTAYSRSIPFDGVSLGEDWTIPINGDDGSYDPNEPILAPGFIGFRSTSYEFDDTTSSRMEMHEGERITFTWSSSDVLGVFPVGGNQTAFPLSSQTGETMALFDGNDWALRDQWRYAAYFPFSKANFHISPSRLPVSFEGQQLDGRHPMANVGKYNFSYAPLVKVDNEEPICFEMKGLATIAKLTMKCPAADTFTKLIISDPQLGIAHEAVYDLMSANPKLETTPDQFYQSLEFDLVNYSVQSPGEPITAYVMLMPGDHRYGSFLFTLIGEHGVYSSEARGRFLNAGSAFSFVLEMKPDENYSESNNQ